MIRNTPARSTLPLIPWLVFTFFEPLGHAGTIFNSVRQPRTFLLEQVPGSLDRPIAPAEHLIILQIGLYCLTQAAVGVCITNFSTQSTVIRSYIQIMTLSDLLRLLLCYDFLGAEAFFDLSTWSSRTWGSVGITAFLLSTRLMYLAGKFGPNVEPEMEAPSSKRDV